MTINGIKVNSISKAIGGFVFASAVIFSNLSCKNGNNSSGDANIGGNRGFDPLKEAFTQHTGPAENVLNLNISPNNPLSDSAHIGNNPVSTTQMMLEKNGD